MKTKRAVISLVLAAIAIAFPAGAYAESLAWNAVTTYTDGSAIGSTPVTYTAVWSTSSNLSSPNTLASATSSLSTTFNITTAAMPRGSTIYFGVKSTVGGVDSAYSSPLSWLVPTLSPSSPVNLRIQ